MPPPQPETISLKTPNRNRIWLTIHTVLACGPQNSLSSRPVELGFEVDAKETNSRERVRESERERESE